MSRKKNTIDSDVATGRDSELETQEEHGRPLSIMPLPQVTEQKGARCRDFQLASGDILIEDAGCVNNQTSGPSSLPSSHRVMANEIGTMTYSHNGSLCYPESTRCQTDQPEFVGENRYVQDEIRIHLVEGNNGIANSRANEPIHIETCRDLNVQDRQMQRVHSIATDEGAAEGTNESQKELCLWYAVRLLSLCTQKTNPLV